jgi:pyridoxal phosphate enzyme (YggS family)
MTVIAANMQAVRSRIARAEAVAGRAPDSVALLAVSKTFSAAAVRECYACGQRMFGENYLQEALDKKRELADLPLEWHFIGPIQSNKTRPIAEHFDWVHGVERAKIAARLNDARLAGMLPLNVCIQVNVSGEASKAGVAPGEEVALAAAIARMPHLKLRGLMTIPEPSTDTALQRRRYVLLRELKQNLEAMGHALDTLSMGMSDDLEAAIAEGATLVRVGTAIFGRRA